MTSTPLARVALAVAAVLAQLGPLAAHAQTVTQVAIQPDKTEYTIAPGGSVTVTLRTLNVSTTQQLSGTDTSFATTGTGLTATAAKLLLTAENAQILSNLTASPPKVITYGYLVPTDANPLLSVTFQAATTVAPGSRILVPVTGVVSDGNYASRTTPALTLTFRVPSASTIPPSSVVSSIPPSSVVSSIPPSTVIPPVTGLGVTVAPKEVAIADGKTAQLTLRSANTSSTQHLTGTQLTATSSSPYLKLTAVTSANLPNESVLFNGAATPPTFLTYGYDIGADADLATLTFALALPTTTTRPIPQTITVTLAGTASDGSFASRTVTPVTATFTVGTVPVAPRIDVTAVDSTLTADGTSATKLEVRFVNYLQGPTDALVPLTLSSSDSFIGTVTPASMSADPAAVATAEVRSGGAEGTATFVVTDTVRKISGSATVTFAASAACKERATVTAFTATPPTVMVGGTSTLSWKTTGGRSLTIQNLPERRLLPLEGTATVTPSATTTYTLVLSPADTACPIVVQPLTVTVKPVQPDLCPVTETPRITSFTADPTFVESGESTTLTWKTEHVSGVTLTPPFTDVVRPANGSATHAPSARTTYLLTATPANAACKAVTSTVFVTVLPTVEGFTATVTVPLEGRTPKGGKHGTYATSTLQVTLSSSTLPNPVTKADLQTGDTGTVTFTLPGVTVPDGTTVTVSAKTGQSLQRVVDARAAGNALSVNLGNPATYRERPGNTLRGRTFLPLGDIEGTGGATHDNVIDAFDVSAWIQAYRSPTPARTAQADVDGNGAAGAEDLSLIIRNFNVRGDQ